MTDRKRVTQAVVVIHGIGEQKPMDTLRSFVESVLPDPESGPKYFSRPDPLSELFELRKLQNRTQPRTHFFEFYWADKADGTRFVHVVSWLKTLLLRPSWKVPDQLLPLWFISWLVIAVTLLGPFVPWVDKAAVTVAGWPIVWGTIAGALLLLVLNLIVIEYVGDAARYLSANPKNIAMRRSIRADGITLLRKLHESHEYDRIVLVGHSLGSVIAYDILKHYWQEVCSTYDLPRPDEQPALAAAERLGLALGEGRAGIEEFRDAQLALWKEQRALGHPWLVTDLITMGSPLAHASVLLADDSRDLSARQEQRELPTCPPFYELEPATGHHKRLRFSFKLWRPFEHANRQFHLRSPHHAAHFACTRWTNLYFPAWFGLFGDIIGGPLSRQFGPGILDVKVATRRWLGLADRLPTIHTQYWPDAGKRLTPAVRDLIAALDLEYLSPSAPQSGVQDEFGCE